MAKTAMMCSAEGCDQSLELEEGAERRADIPPGWWVVKKFLAPALIPGLAGSIRLFDCTLWCAAHAPSLPKRREE